MPANQTIDRFDRSLRPTDRIGVVTGGSRGIGLAIACGFAEAGAKVVVASCNAQVCEEAVSPAVDVSFPPFLRARNGDGVGEDHFSTAATRDLTHSSASE